MSHYPYRAGDTERRMAFLLELIAAAFAAPLIYLFVVAVLSLA